MSFKDLLSQLPKTQANLKTYGSAINQLPKKVQTDVKALGTKATIGDVEDLTKKYHLTPPVVSTLLQALGVKKSKADITAATGLVNAFPRNASVRLLANDNASGSISFVGRLLTGLDGRTAHTSVTNTITTIQRTVKAGAVAGGVIGAAGAYGLVMRGGVRTYAQGGFDVANAHQPLRAKPGVTARVFLEPETQGESYIPHANDARRPRAKTITEQTAALLGGRVTWHAAGSLTQARALGGGQFPTSFRISGGRIRVRGDWATIEDAHLIAADHVDRAFADDADMANEARLVNA